MIIKALHRFHEESGEESGRGIPIKKIFVEKNNVRIDEMTLNDYGKIETPEPMENFLQENFDMPIDTNSSLNLPRKVVASVSPKPYVVINGYVDIKPKSSGTKEKQEGINGKITLRYKKSEASLIISDGEKDKKEISTGDMTLNIDNRRYFINESLLYDIYKKNGIIKDNKLPKELFKKIVDVFFDYMLAKKPEFRKGRASFALYILPNNNPIKYKDETDCGQEVGKDAFGGALTPPDKPTQGVYFLSYDDPAFVINCKDKCGFYRDIGIGEKSLEKVLLPNSKAMRISGFKWYFFDLEHYDKVFEKRSRGIYDQLYYNYKKLKHGDEPRAHYNVICLNESNAKIEVMIDENLTMRKMRSIFGYISENEVIPNAYELLIIQRGRSTIYRYYISAIKSLLGETRVDLDQLYKIFIDEIRHMKDDWLKAKSGSGEAAWFFRQAEFCLKTLYYRNASGVKMNKDEEFAFNVGVMAHNYITFRKNNKFDNNSLKDIVSKSKYDVDTLKYVVKSIGRGINLLKLSDDKYNNIKRELSEAKLPTDLESSNKDLSYHFYAGYFKKEGKGND